MPITITPTGGGAAVTLCHGTGRALGQAMGPSGLSYLLTPGLRERRYVEGTGVRREWTGNDDVSGSFSVAYRFATPALAAACVSSIISSTPRVGTLTDGTITLYDCALTQVAPAARGRSVRVAYAFAGALTQQPQEP